MRVFFDTNVLASAFTARGLCASLYEQVALNHELIIGEPVIEELLRILAGKLRVPADKLALVRAELDGFELAPRTVVPGVQFARDPADAVVLACAVSAKTEVFVTGDKALLDLGTIKNIPILSPRQLWQKLAGLEVESKPK